LYFRRQQSNVQGEGFQLRIVLTTVVLLALSNVFMTFAWYGHLKELNSRSWYVAALLSWGVALFEYLLQVPRTASATRACRCRS